MIAIKFTHLLGSLQPSIRIW